jgi:beta-galactosidase
MIASRKPLSEGWWFSGSDSVVNIPHTIRELPFNHFDEKTYQIEATYRRALHTPDIPQGGAVFLEFEGVAVSCRVSVNGQPVGTHSGPYTPFSFDITKFLSPLNNDNEIEVVVSAAEAPSIPPFGDVVDYLVYGGIYRAVWLRVTGAKYIEWIHALPEYSGAGGGGLSVEVSLGEVEKEREIDQPQRLRLVARLHRGGKLLAETERNVDPDHIAESTEAWNPRANANAGEEVERIDFSGLAGIEPWDIDSPSLYDLDIVLLEGDEPLDSLSCRMGFRSAEFKPEGFFLNGRRVFLRGLNRHQSYPYSGYAMGPGAQRSDARILKMEFGVNMVRTSHYPQSRHFLDACDELGLLVFTEFPGWQHVGDEAWQEAAVRDLRDLIVRDRNHPCVVLWGARVNESQDNHDFYVKTNALAHYSDPYRQTGGVRYIRKSELLEDVYTFNDFTHSGGKAVIADPNKVVGPIAQQQSGGGKSGESLKPMGPWKLWQPLKISGLSRGKPRAPYLITEHNGHMFPTKRYDQEERLVEHARRHARVLEAAMANPAVSGAIGWCAFDYNTHKDFGSGDRICYHGVADMFRIPKYAAFVYASQMDPHEKIVLEPASLFAKGERSAALMLPIDVYTNCDAIDLYRAGKKVARFFPDRKNYPHLEHPPIQIDDFIGSRIDAEGFSASNAKLFTQLAGKAMAIGADQLSVRDKLKFGFFLLRNRMKFREVELLVQKYGMGWGSVDEKIEIAGILDGEEVARRSFGADSAAAGFSLVTDEKKLFTDPNDEWECTRVVVKVVDQYGNTCPFAFEPVSVKISGPGRLIGPENFSLQGGVSAFWVATTGLAGAIKVSVEIPRFGRSITEIEVLRSKRGSGE